MNSPADKPPGWFPEWPDALQQLRLPPLRRQQYRLALIRYLRFCKHTRQRATVESARGFMETVHAQRMLSLSMLATWKEALNWFFTEGRKQTEAVATARRAVRSHDSRGARGDSRVRREAASCEDGATARPGNTITDVPTLGAADMGQTVWERRLIEVLRTRHYQWRTELAYRQWAVDKAFGFRLSAVG